MIHCTNHKEEPTIQYDNNKHKACPSPLSTFVNTPERSHSAIWMRNLSAKAVCKSCLPCVYACSSISLPCAFMENILAYDQLIAMCLDIGIRISHIQSMLLSARLFVCCEWNSRDFYRFIYLSGLRRMWSKRYEWEKWYNRKTAVKTDWLRVGRPQTPIWKWKKLSNLTHDFAFKFN